MLDDTPVAMKFTPATKEEKSSADREFEIYWHLDAVDNNTVEQYGISPIFYYNKYKDYIMMVFLLFEENLYDRMEIIEAGPINSLILFRDFVSNYYYMLCSHFTYRYEFWQKKIFFLYFINL